MNQENQLRTISELKNMNFFVPAYQRGYRWTKSEVEALLNDITDFKNRQHIKENDFYCLQPIVVKKEENEYRVIDGQQRLTTIYLILKYFNSDSSYFSIKYDTRQGSHEYLENIKDNSKNNQEINIDFFHFNNAYNIVENYFENIEDNSEEIKDTLLNRCKVIWYEIDEQENENEVFRRLNMGKIPLLPAENIKALFLMENDEADDDELKDRAEEWYNAEKELREDDDFKYFVLKKIDKDKIFIDKETKKKYYQDDTLRIEVYLESICGKKDIELFDYFYQAYKNNNINDKWKEIKKAIIALSSFTTKENNQTTRAIFHYIGFLIYCDKFINQLYKMWQENQDTEKYKDILYQEVSKEVMKILSGIELEDLSYSTRDYRDKILRILLLFNLDFLIRDNASNNYFKFNRFQLEKWNLEHIYAQNSEAITDAIKNKKLDEIREWILEVESYIEDRALKEEIKNICKSEIDIEEFKKNKELLTKIDENFKSNEELHYLGNLCLLDEDSNKSFGNKIFSKKRREIEKLAEQDKLIPITTKKVFNKDYSSNKSHPDIFSKKDREEYYNEIEKVIIQYNKEEEDE